ncbi:MAG: PAS domain S-box protein [Deltaproteobacteria bacterium]|nr:PAS domain S-box protein [Deltaproteobacteria bacterium]
MKRKVRILFLSAGASLADSPTSYLGYTREGFPSEPVWGLLLASGLGFLFLIFRILLRRRVAARTSELSAALEKLQNEILEREQDAARGREKTSLYALLSQIHQIIAQKPNPQTIFEAVCRIAVEVGRFRLAWIGLADPVTKVVGVAARAGVSDGYLEKINIVLTDEPRGHGPTARALREGRHFISNDITQDPAMEPWRDEALSRGYRASAAFPLAVGGRTEGVFNLYAEKPNFFNNETLQLLDELATSISLALEFHLEEERRRQAEEALRQSEIKFAAAFRASPDAIIITSVADGRIVEVNEAGTRITGYARSELIGRTTADLNFWELPAARDRYVSKLRAQGRVVEMEAGFRIKSGEIRTGLVSGELIDLAGRPHIIGIIRDITERLRMEKNLIKNQALLNQTEGLSRTGGWEYDVPAGKLFWTDEVYRIYGMNPDVYDPNDIDQNIRFYDPADQHAIAEAFGAAIERGEPYDLELRFTAADGRKKWVRTIGQAELKDVRVIRVFGNIMDITEQKETEKKIKEQEELLQETGRIAKIGGWELDPLSGKGTWTEEVARIHDLDPGAETNLEKGLNFYHGPHRQAIERAIREAIEAGKPYDLELEMISAQGNTKWVRTIGHPVKEGDRMVKLRGSFQDISERKLREKSMRETEERFRTAFEYSASGMCLTGLDGKIQKANQTLAAMLGYSREELEGRHYNEITYLEDLEIGQDVVRQLISGQTETAAFEKRYQRKNGDPLWVYIHTSLLKDAAGEPLHFITQIEDISERKQAEEALREKDYLLSEAQRIAQIGSWSWEIPTARISWSDETFRIYGVSPETFVLSDYSFLGLIHPEARPAMQEWIRACIARKNPGDLEFRIIRPDGNIRTLNGRGSLQCAENNTPVRMVGTVQDITERKRVEAELSALNEALKQYTAELEQRVAERTAELNAARQRAESADRLKSVFLATMSHELRTPLNSIIGFTGILLQGLGGPLNAEQTKQLRMVQNSGRHLLNLINDVLDISKIEAGQLKTVREPFDLGQTALKVIETMSPQAQKTGVTIQAEIPPGIKPVNGDQRRTGQVISNLLSNAVKFTPRGGKIRVKISRRQVDCQLSPSGLYPGEVVSKTEPAQPPDKLKTNCLEISVSDSGIGIKPEDMEILFEPFRQIDSGMTRQFEGTGLGLSISKRLVELLGGEIRAESAGPGNGCQFTFTLPVDNE